MTGRMNAWTFKVHINGNDYIFFLKELLFGSWWKLADNVTADNLEI